MIRLNRRPRHKTDLFFITALIILFAVTSFLVIIIGAKQYRFISNKLTANYETRIISSYLAAQFNRYDVSDSIAITDLNKTPSLSFTHSLEGQTHTTYIYAYGGWLRELTVCENEEIIPASGEKIAATDSLLIDTCGSHLYLITIIDTSGNTYPIYISWNAR